jgi:hypothetical protein
MRSHLLCSASLQEHLNAPKGKYPTFDSTTAVPKNDKDYVLKGITPAHPFFKLFMVWIVSVTVDLFIFLFAVICISFCCWLLVICSFLFYLFYFFFIQISRVYFSSQFLINLYRDRSSNVPVVPVDRLTVIVESEADVNFRFDVCMYFFIEMFIHVCVILFYCIDYSSPLFSFNGSVQNYNFCKGCVGWVDIYLNYFFLVSSLFLLVLFFSYGPLFFLIFF